jgi:fumarate reductase flavoprotein subunit
VGILRNAEGLQRGLARLAELEVELSHVGVADDDRVFNISWHDWLNLRNLMSVSKVIAIAALAREDSRGAHFREDFPETGELSTSTYNVVRQCGEEIELTREPVNFTRVKPGQTLIEEPAAA